MLDEHLSLTTFLMTGGAPNWPSSFLVMGTEFSTASSSWTRPPPRCDASKTKFRNEDSVLFCDLGLLARLDEPTFSYIGRAREVTESDALIL